MVAFLVSALVYWGATWVQTYLVGWVGQRVLQDLRIQLFAHLQTLSVGFYSRRQAGVIISRLTNDVQALDQLVSDGVVTLFGSTLTLVGTAVILLLLDVELALLTFLVFPLLALGSLGFRVVSANAYRITREKVAPITAYLQETLSGIRVVRTFAQERRHLERFNELNEDNYDANMKTVYLNAAYFPGVELLSAVATAGILLYGGYQAINGRRDDRRPGGVHRRAEQLLRPDPVALPALHDLPGGHGGARQDLRAARRGARPARPAGRDRARPHPRRDRLRARDVRVRRRATPRWPTSTCTCRRARRSRWSAPPAPASRRSPSSWRASTTRPRARAGRRPRPARRGGAVAALADGDRAAGGVPVQRHDRARTSRSGGRTPTPEEIEAAARAVHAHDFIAGARARLRHADRRARHPALGRASASSSRSRAR